MILLLDKAFEDASSESRTGKLWMFCLKTILTTLQFIYAERTGDWAMHLHCIKEMIPVYHAAGQLAYSKAARLYLQQMNNIHNILSEEDYIKFTQNSCFTVRRKDRYFSGNFTDLTVEQDLMMRKLSTMTRKMMMTTTTV